VARAASRAAKAAAPALSLLSLLDFILRLSPGILLAGEAAVALLPPCDPQPIWTG
jgi:hypothetical protein